MAVELDDRFSEEAKMLARLAPKASMMAVRDVWAYVLSATVLEGEDIVIIAPDGTKTFIKTLTDVCSKACAVTRECSIRQRR